MLLRCSAASSIPAAVGYTEVVPAMTPTSDAIHGKRRRDAESYGNIGPVVGEKHDEPPHKRVRGKASGGILEAAQSMARTRGRPETRVSTKNKHTSEGEWIGAERLAIPNAQGMYPHFLPGPSTRQGRALTEQRQQLLWVEERVEEEASHHVDNTAQQQDKDKLSQIPSTVEEEYWMLLAATEADWARMAVDQIRCRLCPKRRFRKWNDFQRHCKTTEAHPTDISFCEHCGDFFARTDALKRHLGQPPAECLEVKQQRAEEKRRETERLHRDFMERLGRSLITGEDIGAPFAHIIKQKYPESSKKRTGSGWE